MMRKLGNLLIVCITVGLCYFMQVSKPHYAELTGPIPVYASMKDTAEARSFDVHVDKVVFARTLTADAFGEHKTLTTGGLWAVVATSLAATKTSTTVSEAVWQGPGGLRYRSTERLSFATGLPPHSVDPGLPKRGLFVFEIPADQVRDATLLVSAARFAPLDSEVRIRLDGVPTNADGGPAGIVDAYDISKPM
jgi:hypothetical protein